MRTGVQWPSTTGAGTTSDDASLRMPGHGFAQKAARSLPPCPFVVSNHGPLPDCHSRPTTRMSFCPPNVILSLAKNLGWCPSKLTNIRAIILRQGQTLGLHRARPEFIEGLAEVGCPVFGAGSEHAAGSRCPTGRKRSVAKPVLSLSKYGTKWNRMEHFSQMWPVPFLLFRCGAKAVAE